MPAELDGPLERIQNELFDVGADLCVPFAVEGRLRVVQSMIDELEKRLRRVQRVAARAEELRAARLAPPPRPGSTSRVRSCRRAERETLLAAGEHEVNPLVAVYLNRLSDLLFILARAANALAGTDEPLWKPGASRA